jgi:membrane-associated phospholipid phosphatase
MRKILYIVFFLITIKSTAQNNTIEKSGDVLLFAIPTATLVTTLFIKDKKGTWQFSEGLLLTTGLTISLKFLINKERPNGKDNYSFPSGHTATVFQSAAFIQKRYGWKYAIPSYLLATYTGYSRIQSKNHDIVDVVSGAIIGIGSAYLFTSTLEKNNIKISLSINQTNNSFAIIYNF